MGERVPVLLEIDGVDLHPHTVDPRVGGLVIQTFFELLARAAMVRGVAFPLRGLNLRDKCFQIESDTDAPHLAIAAMEVASDWISGAEQADSEADQKLVRQLKSSIRRLGEEPRARLAVGDGWTRNLDLVEDLPPLPPQVTTKLRVRLIQVGVAPAIARFTSGSEDGPFSLRLTTEQAEHLARHLNRPLDIVFSYRRGRTGKIEEGLIEQVYPMDSDDDGTEWRAWLTEAGRHWEDVDDPLGELDRRDD